MNNTFSHFIQHLSERHQLALRWYFERMGQHSYWPEPLSTPYGITYLATRAKGIYKPEWSDYALSVRESLNNPYPDREPEIRSDGTWLYYYYQENIEPSARDRRFTNRALIRCWNNNVPVGVFRQMTGKPHSEYFTQGVALVSGWEEGYYLLEGFSPDGLVKIQLRD